MSIAGSGLKLQSMMSHLEQFKDDEGDAGYKALFRGYALRYFDVYRSEKVLQRVVDDHPTWAFARIMLGGVKAFVATYLDDEERIRQALRETRLAHDTLGDIDVVVMYHLWACRVALQFATVPGEPHDELRQEADAIVLKTKDMYPDNPEWNANVAWYYEEIGDMNAAAEAWKMATGGIDRGWVTCHYVAFLVRQGRQVDALTMLNRMEPTTVLARVSHAFLLAGTEHRDKARALCDQMIENATTAAHKACAIEILCVLGDAENAKKLSERFARELENDDPHEWLDGQIAALEFHANPANISEFDKKCGDTPIGRSRFHFQLALYYLAVKNPQKAAEHFDRHVDTGVMNAAIYWAMAFQKLLEDNPNWPYAGDSQASEPGTN